MTEKCTVTLNEVNKNGGFCVWIKWLGYAVITEGGYYEKLNSVTTSQLVADGQLSLVTSNEEEKYYEVAKCRK